jgi:hypothetical protein
MLKTGLASHCVVLGFAVLAATATLVPAVAADSAFGGLAGNWGGSGTVKYSDGSTERMRCSARYNGGASDVALSINCSSSAHNIDLSGRLHAIGGHVSGNWSESNFGISGSANGKSSPGRVSLGLGGGISGSMSVSYSAAHQDVAISVGGTALESVTMSLAKR